MFNLPKRWEMALLVNSGIVVVYCLRVNMSVAAQDMRDELNWSETQKGLVLSSFYWGYALGQIPASRYASIYGAKGLFGFSVVVPSLITLLVPAACRTSFGLALFSRAVLGLCESASFPCMYQFFPTWVPIDEKPLLISVMVSGMYIGEVIGFASSGFLTTTSKFSIGGLTIGGWDTVFYVFGLMGVLWYPIWVLCAYELPADHPSISKEELDYIIKGKDYVSASTTDEDGKQLLHEPLLVNCTEDGGVTERMSCGSHQSGYRQNYSVEHRRLSSSLVSVDGGVCEAPGTRPSNKPLLDGDIPWWPMLSHKVVWTLFVQGWVFGWVGLTLISEMPSYLTDQLGFDLESAGALSVLPYITLFLSVICSGKIFHWLQENRAWSVRDVRLTAETVAYLGVAVGLVICGFLNNVVAAFAFITLAQGALGVSNSGFLCSPLDIAPKYAPLLTSMSNTWGAVAGIMGPICVASFTTAYPGVWGWRLVFFVTAAQCIIAVFLWYHYQHSDIIPELNTPVIAKVKDSTKPAAKV